MVGGAGAQTAAERCSTEKGDAAIAACSEAIRQQPTQTSFFFRGLRWFEKKEYDKAIADYDEAIKLDRKYVTAYNNRGYVWNVKRDFNKAIADYDEAIKWDPKYVRAYFNRGNALSETGDFDKAIADYNEALRLDPKFTGVYVNRGITSSNKGEFDKAIADYNEAIRLDPKYAPVYINRGYAWNGKGEYDKAIADYNEAIKLDSKYAMAYYNRGYTWNKKGEYDKAIADLNETIKLDPNYLGAYYNRGLAWREKGDYDKAIADFRNVLSINPNHANAAESLQLALEKAERQKKAAPLSTTPSSTSSGKRVALIIGNSSYRTVPALENPARDAELFAKTLRDVGFDDVAVKLNLTRQQMLDALKDFEKAAESADWAAIYFAGHGMEVSGSNYMLPIDVQITDENSISTQTVNIEYLLNAVEVAKKLRLLILDACRNNPYAQRVRVASASRDVGGIGASSIGSGLARVEPQPGTLIVYSAKAGAIALDGDGKNSPFAEALVRRVEQKPPIEVRRLFDFVREDVFTATQKQQQPFSYGSLRASEDFYFAR